MSEPKRMHPIVIVFAIIKNIKDVIIPIVLYFLLFFLRDGKDNIIQFEGGAGWLRKFGPTMFIAGVILLMVIGGIVRWARYTYRLEDMELRIEYGLFVKKKRYIPFERIQSLDFSESILHRPFGLVKVQVETAGSSSNQAEAELTAIKKSDADLIRQEIASAKTMKVEIVDDSSDQVAAQPQEDVIYKISHRQLLFFASTSGRAGVIISAIIAFSAQFEDLIPFDRIFNELGNYVRVGYMLLSILIIIGLVLAWLLSVIMAYLKYNDFTVKKVGEDIVITRGLLEKRTTSIPIRRIQAVKITESPIRQPFGFASVSLENAGGSITDQKNKENLVLPVVKKSEIAGILNKCLDEYNFKVDLEPAPKRANRRYLLVKSLIALIVATGLSIYFWPYGLFSWLLPALAILLGILQYKSAGWNFNGNQLVLRFRSIQQQTVFMRKNRIQSLYMNANWFQRRAGLTNIEAVVMSSGGGHISKVSHINKVDAEKIYEWYRPMREYKNPGSHE